MNADSGNRCSPSSACDVLVLGGGVGGLAASIHLRRCNLRVTCIEPEPFPHDRVGESLDWSAPRLLADLGISRDALVKDCEGFYKRNIEVITTERPTFLAKPPKWFQKWPIGFEVVTLHVDRAAMDQRLFHTAEKLGVEFVWDKVACVDASGDRVATVSTAGGRRLDGRWFIDATGRYGRVLARQFEIPRVDYGRSKVCIWTQFEAVPHNEGTTFYLDSFHEEYVSWVWEIPLSPTAVSVGCIVPSSYVKERRQQGRDLHGILWDKLMPFERFLELRDQEVRIRTTSYRSFVHDHAIGDNWAIVGEAASLPDPLTSNGVTAAFRHAKEISQYIDQSRHRGSFTRRQRWTYNTNLKRMGHAFNHSIETAIYEWPIRWGIGPLPAQKVYTAFSYLVNALYSKLKPRGWISMLFFGITVRGVWTWMTVWSLLGRLNQTVKTAINANHRKSARVANSVAPFNAPVKSHQAEHHAHEPVSGGS